MIAADSRVIHGPAGGQMEWLQPLPPSLGCDVRFVNHSGINSDHMTSWWAWIEGGSLPNRTGGVALGQAEVCQGWRVVWFKLTIKDTGTLGYYTACLCLSAV